MKRILLANDDGIYAPGLKTLWQALHRLADITIVAPLSQQSGISLAVTSRSPLELMKVNFEKNANAWTLNGTPADCVKMALSLLFQDPPDLIISGINDGSNAGKTVLYSGTVGAVMEGALRSIPGIAFSASDLDHLPFQEVEKYVPLILQHVIEHPLPRGSFLNVTFPKKEFKGMKLAKQGRSLWMENPEKRTHPEGHDYYWLGAKWAHCEEEEMSDVFLLKNGFVTAVPIHVEELTDYRYLEEKKAIFEGISKEIC